VTNAAAGAGTVEAVGPQVKRFKKGDRVYGISFLNPKGGFYAQYAVVKENSLALIPGKLTMPQAAAMAVDAVTALAGLETTLGLKNGESLLIFGAPSDPKTSGNTGLILNSFANPPSRSKGSQTPTPAASSGTHVACDTPQSSVKSSEP
jgi:NADPH:quinone reductase-like Zn-dependent oxidoreductase